MVGLAENIGPASETYAGYAWHYLLRNRNYGCDYDTLPNYNQKLEPVSSGLLISYAQSIDTRAHKWGLECFEDPTQDGIDARVFWRQDAFPGALNVHYHSNLPDTDGDAVFNLANFSCCKQHYVRDNGSRITVLKSADFWLQIAGRPSDVEGEDQPFSVLIDGRKGSRRRIDALRQLTSLSRDGLDEFSLLGRQKGYAKMKNGLIAYDIQAKGGSYKDIAIALFGAERVEKDWNPEGCSLKARAVRAFKFGERMVAQDYKSLLPKKTI